MEICKTKVVFSSPEYFNLARPTHNKTWKIINISNKIINIIQKLLNPCEIL